MRNDDASGRAAGISAAEWQLRVDLAAAYRLVAHFGWDDLVFTHLSARVPGPDHHFLLNPYTLGFDEITASSLIKVDREGRPADGSQQPVNPAAFIVHSAVHMGREDAHCVMHLHSPYGQAVSAMSEGLLPLTQQALEVLFDLAYHDYEGLAFDLDERARICADMGSKNLLILRNHGLLTVGEQVADAFLRIYSLERACEAQVRALAAGRGGVLHTPSGAADHVAAQVRAVGAMVSRQLVWPMLMRRLNRIDPSFAT
jgi:ribulose-5-phosphate 4-epimerase/fuculose-1-phosphate aldolase